MKSYTDINQSKKLAEILPIESADCFWDYDDLQKYHRINWFEDGYNKDSQLRLNKNNVCAWSLAALLDIIPNYKISSEHNYHTCTAETSFEKETVAWFDNPIDACYEMILKLKCKRKNKVMKANEMTETYPIQFRDKIDEYLWKEHHIFGGCCSSIESMKYAVAREVAEKLTDDFIEKATKWLKEHITNNPDAKRLVSRSGCVTLGMIIEDFKKAMKV